MKLASIETVVDVQPHPNADRLDVCKVLGWQTVTKRGEFKTGDNGVFIVIDTILPSAPWSEFLADKEKPDKPIRLRMAKIRGQHSAGLLLPLTVLGNSRTWQIGCDVGAELGVKKYEKEIPLALSGQVAGNFPEFIVQRTDEDNGLSNLDIVAHVLRHPVYVTQKLDGSSCTVIIEGGKVTQVCSRNLSLKDTDGNAFWHAARKLKTHTMPDCVLQGELMGPGIQGNQLGLTEPTLYLFNGFVNRQPVTYQSLEFKADTMGCRIVPGIDARPSTVEVCQSIADSQTLPNGKPAEGIVVRIKPPQLFGNGRVAGFKIINRNYKDT